MFFLRDSFTLRQRQLASPTGGITLIIPICISFPCLTRTVMIPIHCPNPLRPNKPLYKRFHANHLDFHATFNPSQGERRVKRVVSCPEEDYRSPGMGKHFLS